MSQKIYSNVVIKGDLTLVTANAGLDTDKFLVQDASGKIAYRTGAEVLLDIGAGTGGGGGTTYAETPSGTINGSNTIFTLLNTPSNAAAVMVLLDGVSQYNGIDYTVAINTITFTTAPATGSSIFCYYNLLSGSSGENYWTKTGDIIRNNNTGNVEFFSSNWYVSPTGYGRFNSIEGNYVYANVGVQLPNGGWIACDGDSTNYIKGFRDDKWLSDIKFKYLTDLSASYDDRTLIDKGYLDTRLGAIGGFTTINTEVNLGTVPRRSGKFTITSTGLTVGKDVVITQAVGPYTGKGSLADETEMDMLIVTGKVTSTTTIICYWNSSTFVKGNFKFNYVVSA